MKPIKQPGFHRNLRRSFFFRGCIGLSRFWHLVTGGVSSLLHSVLVFEPFFTPIHGEMMQFD